MKCNDCDIFLFQFDNSTFLEVLGSSCFRHWREVGIFFGRYHDREGHLFMITIMMTILIMITVIGFV